MKENFLHFLSEVPCILSINGKVVGSIDGTSEIDVVTKTNHIYVTYEPISKSVNALAYTYELRTYDTPATDNEYIKVVPFPNNNYDIIMKPFYYYQIGVSNVLVNETVGKYFVSIVCDNQTKVIIYSGAGIVFSSYIPLLEKATVKLEKDIMIIEGVINTNTYYLLVLDTKDFSVLFSDTTHSIEIENSSILSYKKMDTINKHALVTNINFDSKQKDSYYVYDNNAPNKNICPLLIPMAFLQCVAVGDGTLAKEFLSDSLKTTNITQLKNYFGDIKEIYFNKHTDSLSKLNYTILSDTFKNYNFILSENKITEIELK